MKYNIIVMSFIILLALGSLMYLNFKTGNVVIGYQESYKSGDDYKGDISLTIAPSESISKDTKILLSLSKNNTIIEAKTFSVEEFIKLSGKNPQIIQKHGGYYYETPDVYTVKINKLFEHPLSEKGEYEILFNILEIGLTVKKEISID